MRLFVALDLPWEVKRSLAAFAINLAGARWVPPQNMHLTLRFIGERKGGEAEEIDYALSRIQAREFSLVLTTTLVLLEILRARANLPML